MWTPPALVLLALLAFPVQAATTYRCTDRQGHESFQQQPCAALAQQREVRVPPPPPLQAAVPLDDQATVVRATLFIKHQCDEAVPGFRDKTAADWERWRGANLREVMRAELDAQFRAQLAQQPSQRSEDTESLRNRCVDFIEALNRSVRGPDPLALARRPGPGTRGSPRYGAAIAPRRWSAWWGRRETIIGRGLRS